jgi:hypothetical protein
MGVRVVVVVFWGRLGEFGCSHSTHTAATATAATATAATATAATATAAAAAAPVP